jgi:putative peptidoglycan lipid II flippase
MAVTDETTHTDLSGASTPLAASAADCRQPFERPGFPVENSGEPSSETEESARDARGSVGPRQTEGSYSSDDVGLIQGACVADGRYRLLRFHGGPEGLQFWQALDAMLGTQVALTLIDPHGILPGEYIQELLACTLRLSRLDTPGIARVLDVARTGPGALVASEWIRGGSLREVADTAPSPIGAARAMQSLAAATEAAHRAGLALSLDHPARVRVSVDGDVALAFPATLPDATPEDDVRGMGAVLYALLANRWPLPESGASSGLAPAEFETQPRPKELTTIDPDIPFQISAAAAGSLRERGGIRDATMLLNILERAIADTESREPDSPAQRFAHVPRAQLAAQRRRDRWRDLTATLRRNRILVGFAVGAAAIVAVLLLVASALSRIIGSGDSGVSLDQQNRLGLHPSASSPPSPAPTATRGEVAVKPLRATVFSPGGGVDNPQSAGLAIDGDPGTAWSTDTYFDAVPFPGFKDGVGLLLQLPQPTVLSAVTVDLDSTGTVVQIRSSPTTTPAKLADTTELTPPTPMQPGHNNIPVHTRTPASTVLVWISTLGTTGGKSRTDISEITLQAAR